MGPAAQDLVLYGGTFNPIHLGHLIVAEEVRRRFGAGQRVLFMPAAQPPHKAEDLAPAHHRLAMVRLAVADNPGFDVSDLELTRTGPSYTIDTVRELQRREPERRVRVLVGADSVPELPTWREAPALVRESQIVVAARPGWDVGRLDALRDAFDAEVLDGLRRHWFDTPLVGISGTEIRRRLRAGESVRYWVPAAVEEYVQRNGLYGTGGTRVLE